MTVYFSRTPYKNMILFSEDTQLSFMERWHKPPLIRQWILGHIVIPALVQSPVPVSHTRGGIVCLRRGFELKFLAWLGPSFWLHFPRDQLPVTGSALLTPKQDVSTGKETTPGCFLLLMKTATFKPPNVILNFILKWKWTSWKTPYSFCWFEFRTWLQDSKRNCWQMLPYLPHTLFLLCFLTWLALHCLTPSKQMQGEQNNLVLVLLKLTITF